MYENPNELTVDDSVLVLIDHQPWVAFAVDSIDRNLLINNLVGIAEVAKALQVPTVLTTVGASGGPLRDPIFGVLSEIFPDTAPIDRVSTNAWADIKPAVEATGRRSLVMAGLWTEVCVAQTALSAINDGYRVYVLSDCCGAVSKEAHEDAKVRMSQAGATPINWVALAAEWTPDYTSDIRYAINGHLVRRAGAVGAAIEYIIAQS